MNSVEDLDINPKIKTSLKKVGLTSFGQILTLSIQDIQRLTKLSQGEVTGIKTAIALQVMPQPSLTAFDIQKLTDKCPDRLKIGKLSTGCKQIDEALRGGILTRGITEIAGESASGKTQFCLQLCLSVQLPHNLGGLSAGAAYICTEDVFPSKRLGQMIGYFSQRTDIHKKIAFGDNIFIEHVADLVTDSMQTLHRRQIPALGLAWSNQITCRLSLARTSHELDLPRNILNGVVIGGFPTSIRTLEVTFAPNLPNLELVYVIDQEGIKTVS
ncbi:DNA repair protein XRCC3-like isoform X5 [Ostrea edulis]|uniref:DNA repair protein XRCC3-like isoform X5 n=1 Tax=Ostrea edulis TaxID=37623 RepID=UPI0024AF91D8|nr:DNA repair protein XRCC3-like isoform X5 [Ostrea edulis]